MDTVIEVDGLTRRYGSRTAVDGISFRVGRGEIVGFLGPNGAGKTTTMRMLAGFLPPTAGTIRVVGRDLGAESMQIRRRVGYMPENVPLYGEMRVQEYLRYRAALRGLPAAGRRGRVDEVTDRCGLADSRRRIIGQLSKGYRQRVGLAEALLADPDVLILDEPTIGLDPHQIRQVRSLIRDLAPAHTVLLSTHILPEVEMTCGRVIILQHGRIVASDAPDALSRRLRAGGAVRIEVRAAPEKVRAALEAVDGVESVDVGSDRGMDGRALTTASRPGDGSVADDGTDLGWTVARVEPAVPRDLREAVHAAANGRGWAVRELTRDRLTLEEIFVQVTSQEEEPTSSATPGEVSS